jgi:endogenous inhibitor of DNA gyrase (YacG/DUF329 family)
MREVSPIVPRSKVEITTCVVCGAKFRLNTRGRKRLYCSKQCQNIAINRRKRKTVGR